MCDFQQHHSRKNSTSRSEAPFSCNTHLHTQKTCPPSSAASTLICEIVGWVGAGGHAFNVHPSAASALCCCCNGHPHTALMLMLGSSNRRCRRTWGRLSASAREVRGSRKMQCALLPRLPNQQYYLSTARACGCKGCPHGVGFLCFFLGATKILLDEYAGSAGTYTRVHSLERLRQ